MASKKLNKEELFKQLLIEKIKDLKSTISYWKKDLVLQEKELAELNETLKELSN